MGTAHALYQSTGEANQVPHTSCPRYARFSYTLASHDRCFRSIGRAARDRIVSYADAAVAVMEVTMHKVIGVMSLVSALVISQSVNAQGVELAKLPSIDSIAATTDIRPFLALGVPLRLVRAALRRA